MEDELPRAQRRRMERLAAMPIKKQADNLLWLLEKFPLDQKKDQTIEFAKIARDHASAAAIPLFLQVPEIKARLEIAKPNKSTDRGTKQNPSNDRGQDRKRDG